jgi:hypothetical protein
MDLHSRMIAQLRGGQLFDGKETELKKPPLFKSVVMQNVDTARGADAEANLNTFRKKYGPNYEAHQSLAREILERCSLPKS